jgi:hypothetical protein
VLRIGEALLAFVEECLKCKKLRERRRCSRSRSRSRVGVIITPSRSTSRSIWVGIIYEFIPKIYKVYTIVIITLLHCRHSPSLSPTKC